MCKLWNFQKGLTVDKGQADGKYLSKHDTLLTVVRGPVGRLDQDLKRTGQVRRVAVLARGRGRGSAGTTSRSGGARVGLPGQGVVGYVQRTHAVPADAWSVKCNYWC